MFGMLKNMATNKALNFFREKAVNPNLDGIGVITSISLLDKMLYLTLMLDGLGETEIIITGKGISIAEDGSSITVQSFKSNMPFAENALNRFAAGRHFELPEGNARSYAMMAKKILGL